MQTNRGTGTWSEVVYWLRQQGMAANRRAKATTDPELQSLLKRHGAMCSFTARKLHREILYQAHRSKEFKEAVRQAADAFLAEQRGTSC